MGRISKRKLADLLKSYGYFSKYKTVNEVIREFSWEVLNTYYRELISNKFNRKI